jgi:PAS domain S-box-containing protein
MKSLHSNVVIKVSLYSIIILITMLVVFTYLIERKAESTIPDSINFIRDTKFKSLNKDNLATAFEFSNLNYTSYILNENGTMFVENKYVVDPAIIALCKETADAANQKIGPTTLTKYVTIKKNGKLCFVVEANTNNTAALGIYARNILYVLVAIYFLFMYFFLWRSFRKISKPIKTIIENTENSLVSKWEAIKTVPTKVTELQNLEKYSGYLIELLKQKTTGENSDKIIEIKDYQSKFLNRKLESNANKFKLAVDSAGDVVVIVDKFGYINYSNKALTHLTDYRFEDVENKKITDLWHKDDDVNVWKKNYEEVSKTKSSIQFSSWGIKKGNIKFESAIQISPIKNNDDSVDSYLVVERDITEEKQKERIKGEFISVVSHELRTPMTVIRGYSTLLAEGKLGDLNDKQKEYVNKINTETGQLLELANDMLDIQKFESGKIELKFEKTKIPDFVKNIVDSSVEMYSKKNLKLTFENNLTKDSTTNLLSNAYKYTEKGEVKVFLVNPDDDHIVIAVKDTGVGIKEESLTHLFERFYQADGVLQRKQEGSGLGLSIVKRVAESHNGYVWAESKLGVGSTFYVAIPII